jgi:predicted HTH domain antitoxin
VEDYVMTMGHKQEALLSRKSKEDREIIVTIIEEHLASLEKASLILVSSIQRQRELLEELKALERWGWKIQAPPALFGDAGLFEEYQVSVVQRTGHSREA